MNQPLGVHYILEFCGCENEHLLRNVDGVDKVMVQAAREGRASVVSHHFHQFEPWGVSGVVVLEESHITIHTWPENQYAAIDVFFCDQVNVRYEDLRAYLEQQLRPSHVEETRIERGTSAHLRVVAA